MSPLDHSPEGVRYAIKQAGLTQTEVAEQMHVAKSQVTAWLKGERNITPANLKLLASVLNCPRVVLEAKLDEVSA